MKSRTISIILAAVLAFLLPQLAQAQIAASNPLEWVALAEGNELINGQIDKQIKGQVSGRFGLQRCHQVSHQSEETDRYARHQLCPA